MVYAAQSDLVPLRLTMKQLIELTTENRDAPEPDSSVVTAALTEASGLVDAYCGQRYKLPLQETQVVKSTTIDITVYLLYTRRKELLPTSSPAIRYGNAIALLKDISRGNASLDQPDAPLETQQSSAEVAVSSKPQRFSDCNLEGWG